MVKLKVYVRSFEIPTEGFVDAEGARHACAEAQKTAYQGLERHGGLFGTRCVTDEETEALTRIENFCRNNALEYEIVDVGSLSFFARLGLRMKGIKTPTVCLGERMMHGVPSDEDIRNILKG
jgi:hypothetical protein